jgi:tRNA nucleotidyltransferase (CCA-adding enzyme)
MKPERIRVHKFMCRYPMEILEKLKVLQRADILAHSPLGLNRLTRLEELNNISEELKASGAVFDIKDLAIDGKDIIALGVKEGPVVGEILKQVFERYLDERCLNSKDSLIEEARKIVSTKSV